jgi:hypothetical protein
MLRTAFDDQGENAGFSHPSRASSAGEIQSFNDCLENCSDDEVNHLRNAASYSMNGSLIIRLANPLKQAEDR